MFAPQKAKPINQNKPYYELRCGSQTLNMEQKVSEIMKDFDTRTGPKNSYIIFKIFSGRKTVFHRVQ